MNESWMENQKPDPAQHQQQKESKLSKIDSKFLSQKDLIKSFPDEVMDTTRNWSRIHGLYERS